MTAMTYDDRRERYRRKLREQRMKEIRFNRAVLAAVLGVTLVAGGAALLFGINSLMGGKKSDSAVSILSSGMNGRTAVVSAASISTGSESIAKESSVNVESSMASLKSSSENTSEEAEETSSDTEEDSALKSVSKDAANKYFKNAVFIGDSRTQGLQINSGVTSADYLAGRGLNVKTVYTEKVIQNKMTVLDALKQKKYKKIYICYGLNELGWAYSDVFIEDYGKLIDDIKKLQPDAKIVVESILPVTKKKSTSDKIFNMKHVNKYNKLIKKMCSEKEGVKYVNLAPAVKNKEGYLPASATTDGIHMNKEYCRKVISYIVNKKY